MYIHTQRKLIIETELYTSIHQHKISYNMKMQLAQWFDYIATTNGWDKSITYFTFFPFTQYMMINTKTCLSLLLLTKPSTNSYIPHSQNWNWNGQLKLKMQEHGHLPALYSSPQIHPSLLWVGSEGNQPIQRVFWYISQFDELSSRLHSMHMK